MNDAGALLATNAAKPGDVVEERVDEGAMVVTGRGMDDHSGRLIDHHQIRVIVQDRERERFGHRCRGRHGGDLQLHAVADMHGMARAH